MHHLIFGNDHSRRANHWRNALGDAPVQSINYEQVALEHFPTINEPTTIRITSPGEDFETFKLLVQLGGYTNADQLQFEKGRILLHSFWYKGWCMLLDKIHQFIHEHPLAVVMNHPTPIKLAFHKTACQQQLEKANLPIPKIVCSHLNSFEELRTILTTNGLTRVFLKPAHGSSASGIMMFRDIGKRMLLETTIHVTQKGGAIKLFNHKRLQRYHDPTIIQSIIENMIPNQLHVEQWVIKKRFQAKSTDFRVLTINQQPVFIQPRHSTHPITNLHLGNEKGSIQPLEQEWGKSIIENVKEIARLTAEQLPGLFYAGIDIAVDQAGNPYVLEVNPFGDFLKDIYVDGLTTYEYELRRWKEHLPYQKELNTKPIC